MRVRATSCILILLCVLPVLAAKKAALGPLGSVEHWTGSEADKITLELAKAMQDLNPDDSRNLARVGELMLKAGLTADAEKAFIQAIDSDKNDDEACRIIAVAYRDEQMWEKADEWFKVAVDMDPEDMDHLVEWGLSYWLRGDKAKAAELFTRALSAAPGTARLYHKIGQGISR